MASIYHKKYTRPMPEGAEVFERGGQRWARWTDGNGATRTAPVTARLAELQELMVTRQKRRAEVRRELEALKARAVDLD